MNLHGAVCVNLETLPRYGMNCMVACVALPASNRHIDIQRIDLADAILDCSDRGDVVLDSFLGSGSTVIAAERVGRVCYFAQVE